MDRPAGSITYTQFLNNNGGIESDVTVTRLAEDTFRVISGTSFVSNDLGWIKMHMPGDGSVEVNDVTENWACLSLWGPNARRVLQSVSSSDVSNNAFPYMSARTIDVQGITLWAQRVSYAGELGWELYMAPKDGIKVWDALVDAGKECGIQPIGYKALDTLRIEKGYLYWSGDITPDDNPYEAGLNLFVDLEKGDFIGREALLKIRDEGLCTKLCAVTMDANINLYGGESVYVNDSIVGRIRTGNYGYSIGKDIGLVYLPLDLTEAGTGLEVEVLGERINAQVAKIPLVDPKGERLRV
jgi:4-methylaminobutanoate oxidase (formaldehyde-forming)